jgi:hypothetical protein
LQRGLQERRERRPGLQVPEVLIEASANIAVKAGSVRVRAPCRPHCGRGTAPPFIGQEEAVYRRAALFLLRVVVWRTVPWSRRPS